MGPNTDDISIPTTLVFPPDSSGSIPKVITLGPTAGASIDEHGLLMTWGTGASGQLGHDNEDDQYRPKIVAALRQCVVTQVTLGTNHAACITDTGSLYTWGDGSWGKLGLQDIHSRLAPEIVMTLALSKVTSVSLASKHSACVTENHQLYTWGAGSFGRLCSGGTSQTHFPRLAKVHKPKKDANLPLPDSDSDSSTDDDTDNDDHHIGALFDADGDGVIDFSDLAQVKALAGYRIASVHLSDVRTAIITCGGKLFLCGRQFLTESGNVEDWIKPKLMDGFDSPVASFSMTDNVCGAVTRSGSLYTWGKNTSGVLGHGADQRQDCVRPARVKKLTGHMISQICFGQTHACCISRIGRVFTWGFDKHGHHGRGDDITATKSEGSHNSEPRLVKAFQDWTASSAACGAFTTAVLVEPQPLGCKPTIKLQPPATITICVGTPFELPITCGEGDPVPSASWTCNGVPVSNENKHSRLGKLAKAKATRGSPTDGSKGGKPPSSASSSSPSSSSPRGYRGVHDLYVKSVTLEHQGEWCCKLENRCGHVTSNVCQVRVTSLEQWADAAAVEKSQAEAALGACQASLAQLRSASVQHLLQGKQQAEQDVAAGKDALVAAKRILRETQNRAKIAASAADKLAQEQHRQLKFCRYSSTAVAKRGMAALTRQVAEAWEHAAALEEEVNRDGSGVVRAAKRIKTLEKALERATARAKEPEDRIKNSEVTLERCKKRLLDAKQALEMAAHALSRAKATLAAASHPSDELTASKVVACFATNSGWAESSVLGLKAMQTLTALASATPALLESVNGSGAEALAKKILSIFPAIGGEDGHRRLSTAAPVGTAAQESRKGREAGQAAAELSSIMNASRRIKQAAKLHDVSTVTESMQRHCNVTSLLQIGCDILCSEEVAGSTQSGKEAHAAVNALRAAQAAMKGHQSKLTTTRQIYEVIAWAFDNSLGSYSHHFLREHYVKLQYVKDSLNAEVLRDWGMSHADVDRTLRAVRSLPMGRTPVTADPAALRDMLSMAYSAGYSAEQLQEMLRMGDGRSGGGSGDMRAERRKKKKENGESWGPQ